MTRGTLILRAKIRVPRMLTEPLKNCGVQLYEEPYADVLTVRSLNPTLLAEAENAMKCVSESWVGKRHVLHLSLPIPLQCSSGVVAYGVYKSPYLYSEFGTALDAGNLVFVGEGGNVRLLDAVPVSISAAAPLNVTAFEIIKDEVAEGAAGRTDAAGSTIVATTYHDSSERQVRRGGKHGKDEFISAKELNVIEAILQLCTSPLSLEETEINKIRRAELHRRITWWGNDDVARLFFSEDWSRSPRTTAESGEFVPAEAACGGPTGPTPAAATRGDQQDENVRPGGDGTPLDPASLLEEWTEWTSHRHRRKDE